MMTNPSRNPPPSLQSLLQGVCDGFTASDLNKMVTGLSLDSRRLDSGDVFFALHGQHHDGLYFARAAVEKGAVAIVHQGDADEVLRHLAIQHNVPLIRDPELPQHLGIIASRFYEEPSRHLSVVGVTGTDGKTSVSHFITQCIDTINAEHGMGRCGVIGTLGNGFRDKLDNATHTTPDAIRVQALLADFRDRHAKYVAMETSSHGLDQGRVNGVAFEVAVLTNLGRDHLDYHVDHDAYRRAKQRLFEMPELQSAVVNMHDAFGQTLLSGFGKRYPISAYGVAGGKAFDQSLADDWVTAENISFDNKGFAAKILTPEAAYEVRCSLLGYFNVLNVLTSIAVLRRLLFPMDRIIPAINRLQSVVGRMQLTQYEGLPAVVVDYAHTPQALQAALKALRPHCRGQLWCVFGCGGNRDAGKRPEMGRIAESSADKVIVTDDNPRDEEPALIAGQILAGMHTPEYASLIHDRHKAIHTAIHSAGADDLILIAGKGHERTQMIGERVLPFHDQTAVNDALSELGGQQL
jgi:UDP-N-acetylmuramoyl-L-alanyl-D-glutamate--2,6-diaminopimelate ligase